MDKVGNLEDIDKRVLERMHSQLFERYSELMRIERSKVTADMVLNSAPGALQLVQMHIAANVVDKCVLYPCVSKAAEVSAVDSPLAPSSIEP